MPQSVDEILSGAEPTQEAPVADKSSTEPVNDGQPRTADGKFASKEPNQPEEPEPSSSPAPEPKPTAEKPQGHVPQQALHAAREKAKSAEERAADLERQLAELRGSVTTLVQQRQQPAPAPVAPPKPVEFWEAPDKFVEAALTPLQQELAETRFTLSQQTAIAKYGEEAVKTAEQALQSAIQSGELNGETVQAQLRRSRDPVGDAVRWHLNSPAVREQTLREQIRAEILAEQGNAPALQNPAPEPAPQVMPSNLVGTRNVGTRSGPAWSGPQSINDIFDRSRKKAG